VLQPDTIVFVPSTRAGTRPAGNALEHVLCVVTKNIYYVCYQGLRARACPAMRHALARALSLPFSLSKRTHTHTQVESCLFQFHSKADEYVPYSMGQKLWDAKGSDPRCSLWVSHDTALHDDAITKVEQLSLKEWLAKL